MRSPPFGLALLTAFAAACAEAPVRAPAAALYRGWTVTLPSGLRLVVFERPGARHFRLAASYLGGTSADPPGQEGAAVLVARLAERARPSTGALAERILAAGSSAETHVTRSDLVFEHRGRAAALRTAMEVERDRLVDPLAGVGDDEILQAQEALALELSLEVDRGGDDLHLSALLSRAFPEDPGARPRGTAASVRSLSPGSLRAWAKGQLSPERLVLVISAPGHAEEVGRTAAEILGAGAPLQRVPPAAAAPIRAPPPPPAAMPALRETSDGPRLWLAWLLPEEVAARSVAVETALAAAHAAAAQRIRRPDLTPATRGVVGRTERLPGGAVVALGIGLRADRDAEVVAEAVGTEVAQFVSSPAAAWGLAQIGDRLRRLAFLEGEDVHLAEAARWLRSTGQADYLAGYQAQIAGLARHGIPPSTVAAFAKPRMRSLLVLPLRPAPPDMEAAGFVFGATAGRLLASAAPAPGAVRDLLSHAGFARYQRTLRNGLEVVVVPLGEYPTIVARLVLRSPYGGTRPFPAGLDRLALGMAEKSWSAGGAFTCPSVERLAGREVIGFQVAGPSGELAAALQALQCATRSRAVGDGFLAARDARAKALDDGDRHAFAPGLRALYPDHPYGSVPDPVALGAATTADAERWLTALLRPDRATLLVAGKVTPGAALDALVDSAFGGWSAGAEPLADAALPGPGRGSVVLAAQEYSPAARVSVLVRAPSKDREASLALRHLLAERLDGALPREVMSTVGVAILRLDQLVVANAHCGARETASVVNRLLGEIRLLAERGVSAEEAARARWLVARDMAARLDTAALAVADLTAAAELGAIPDEAARVESVATLSAERITAVARRLGAGREAVTVLGGRNLLTALKAVGLEVQLLEPKKEGAGGK